MLFTLTGLALLLLAAPPGVNVLPGDTAFTTGTGPFVITDAPALNDRPELRGGELRLPSPGCAVSLPLTPPLLAGERYTLACRARAESPGVALEFSAADAFGRGGNGRVALAGAWRDCQLTFQVFAPPADEEQAQAMGVDWSRRVETVPPELAKAPAVSLAIRSVGGAGAAAWIDDVRLVRGAAAVAVEPPELAVDATWVDSAVPRPLRAGEPGSLLVRAIGPAETVAGCRLVDPDGFVRLEVALPAGAEQAWQVALPALPAGCYRVELTAQAGRRQARQVRLLTVLRDLRDDPAARAAGLAAADVARPAEALALGFARARVVVTWAELVDDDGRPALDALAARLRPALAAGMEIALALRLTPQGALPPSVLTPRRMDSHGYNRGVALPDMERFEAFAGALAARFAGAGLVWELDDEAWRWWNAGDYTEYQKRFAAAVRKADPTARLAGCGWTAEAPLGEPKVTPFLDEVLRRGGTGGLARVTFSLPGRLGDAPEDYLGVGLGTLAEQLAPRAAGPAEVVAAGLVAAGPLDRDTPRAAPLGGLAAELSPWQLAARTVRTLLLASPLRPAVFPTGWSGGYGPREAALNVWLARYRGASFVASVPLGGGLRGVVFELPNRLGLGAVWDPADGRWSAGEPQDEPPVTLTVPVTRGVMLRARTLYGRWLSECEVDGKLLLPLGFEPVYLEGTSAEGVTRALSLAVVRGHEAVDVAARLAVEDGRPGLLLQVAERGGSESSGEARLSPGPGVALGGERLGYDVLPGEERRLFVPLTAWETSVAAKIGVLAEAGRELVDRSRDLLCWPLPERPLDFQIDAQTADWDAALLTYHLGTAERLADPESDWRGAEDASLTFRGTCDGRELDLLAEVADDHIAESTGQPFDNSDAVELILDLDLEAGALRAADGPSDYRLVLSPSYDGFFQGRCRLTRGPGSGDALLDEGGLRARFLRLVNGWRVEARVPLTAAGQAALARNAGFGLNVILDDDDSGAGRKARLVMFGPPALAGARPGLAQVWLARGQLRGGLFKSASTERALPLLRIGFESPAEPYHLTPEGFGAAVVRQVVHDDFVRGQRLLRVELEPHTDGSAAVAVIQPPDSPTGFYQVRAWARARPSDPALPRPRLGLRSTGGEHWWEPAAAWRRYDALLPAGGPLRLLASGAGCLEVAEVNLDTGFPEGCRHDSGSGEAR